jgi:hypothetical protein
LPNRGRLRRWPVVRALVPAASPSPSWSRPLAAGGPWRKDFQASKGLAALDQHQVRRWTSWYRWVTLAMTALAFLTIAALTEHAQPPPPGLIPLTRNEIARLAAALII